MSLSVDASVIFYTDTLKEAWLELALSGVLVVIFVVTFGLPAWLAYVMMRPSRRAALDEIGARRRCDHEAMQQEIAGGREEIGPRLTSLRSLDEAERYVRGRYPVLPFRRPALLTVNALSTFSLILGATSTAVALIRTL